MAPDAVLDFWFGGLAPEQRVPPERLKLWFGGSRTTDALIRRHFAESLALAARGEYDSWQDSPRPTLALIVLLDQFSRNIYRKKPAAFACDARAREICLAGLAQGFDAGLAPFEKAFFYLPLEHAEDLELQQRSVDLFAGLVATATPEQKGMCESFYDYALRHQQVIIRFGRFPHRNAILGRPSTAEELAFLKQPGSSF